MGSPLYHIALAIISVTALGRVVGILILKVRQSRYAKKAVALPSSWKDRCTSPEPYLLGAVTLWLILTHHSPSEPSASALVQVSAGFFIALVAAVLMLWSLKEFPSVSTGHYVLPDQQVVSHGPYALVRHPLYLAAFLVWLSLSIGFSSIAAFVITVVYVIPAYVVYLRAEEEMLLQNLGDAYAEYRQEVGMLFPRRGRSRASGSGDASS